MPTKKAPTKKTTPKKKPAAKSAKSKKTSPALSLKKHVGLAPEQESFMTFRVNRQTVYWLVLGAIVILFTMWILKIQSDIESLYDQIEMSATETL